MRITSTSRMTARRWLAIALAAVVVVAGTLLGNGNQADAAKSTYLPAAGHVFVINLENKGYDQTWGPGSAGPYLSTTLRAQGVLLNQYFGTAHNSLPNYIAQISGQGPNPQTQGDCQIYSPFVGTQTAPPGQAVGDGCVYPASVPTLAGQLTSSGRTWKGYMEDMGAPCRHPALGAIDNTQKARVGDQYAARHNPFVYFAGITGSLDCAQHDVDLSQLPTDLASAATTPTLSYITPNLCHDGHDTPCVDGQPGGLASADAWLKQWVPVITNSPAFGKDGVLVITFDESDSPASDSSACCGEGPGPNSPLPGITGLGGGRVGALVLSPFTQGGTWSTTPYNHYSLLASIEDLFALPYLGYAASPGLNRFGLDVYNGAVSGTHPPQCPQGGERAAQEKCTQAPRPAPRPPHGNEGSAAYPESTQCASSWKLVGSDTFRLPSGLTRSQGVTTDGQGWMFSWQGGLERTDGSYLTQAVGTWPAQIAVQPQVNPDGTNHVGGNHIGDIDYYNGLIYAPIEDGGENLQVAKLNNPEYQHPYIALYDAKTLLPTGVTYPLDKSIHEAGVPWVAVNAKRREVYTAEWDMPHDRLNVFDTQMRFQRFLPLVYPTSLGAGFHLSRIQGAKVLGHTMFATRDDTDKTIFSIDLRTGDVTKLFSLQPGVPAELEGLAIRPTPDGALLHVLIILNNKVDSTGDATNIRTVLEHFAPVQTAGCNDEGGSSVD